MKFLIVGGDSRNIKLIESLRNDGHQIYAYGLKDNDLQNFPILEDQVFDAVIGPIPFTKDGESLNAPFIEGKILINELLTLLEHQTLIAGPISKNLKEKMEKHNIRIVDIMESEELVIYNTIATAEGTIEIAIANTERNLHESKVLILGFGRVAKVLATKLKGLTNYITCAARKSEDFAWMDTLGFNIENIKNLGYNLNKYDIIINTVPHIVLTQEKLENIRKDALIIDLASEPGGINQEAIKKMHLKYIWALALPGKIAPLSSAKYIKQAIYNIMDCK